MRHLFSMLMLCLCSTHIAAAQPLESEMLEVEVEEHWAECGATRAECIERANADGLSYGEYSKAFFELAEGERWHQNYDAALSAIDASIANGQLAGLDDSNMADRFSKRAVINSEADRIQQAKDDFYRALELDPENSSIHFKQANLFRSTGEVENAISAYDEVLKLMPRHARALVYRGGLLGEVGRYDEAIADLQLALSVNRNPFFDDPQPVLDRVLAAQSAALQQSQTGEVLQPIENQDVSSELDRVTALPAPGNELSTKRVALIIGNQNYDHTSDVNTATNDATDVEQLLRYHGFDISGGGPQLDLSRHDLITAVQRFEEEVLGVHTALIWYVGHGSSYPTAESDGATATNWIFPTDSHITRLSDVQRDGVRTSLFSQAVAGAESFRVVVLDACRNNTFYSRAASGTEGYVREEVRGAFVVYSTAPGKIALTSGANRNSPFARSFLEASDRLSNIGLRRLFGEVARLTLLYTGNSQEPERIDRTVSTEEFPLSTL